MTRKPKSKKAKTLKAPITHVALLLDCSGSMSSVVEATIDGFNEQLATIRANAAEGDDVRVTVVEFGGDGRAGVRMLHASEAVEQVQPLTRETYRPRGNTPMYDAVGDTVRGLEGKDVAEEDVAFLFVVISDGHENASRHWTRETIAALVQAKQDTGRWTFTYIGANQNLADIRQHLGFANVMGYRPDSAGTAGMLLDTARGAGAYLNARSVGLNNAQASAAYAANSGSCAQCHWTGGYHAPDCPALAPTPTP